MIGDITVADEIYIVCGYTDMRKSIDGLCAIVEDKLHMDPRRKAIFLCFLQPPFGKSCKVKMDNRACPKRTMLQPGSPASCDAEEIPLQTGY